MKAISIHPKYAMAIALNIKTIELRSWRTSYRGDILICTTKSGSNDPSINDKYIFGHAVALATITDCIAYKPGLRRYCLVERYVYLWDQQCFMLENIRPIKPIPVRGQQRIYNTPIEKDDIQFLNIDTKKDQDKLIDYWIKNGYIKDNPRIKSTEAF